MTSTRPSVPMSTLSGLKSRWTSPAAWAAARPRPAFTNASTMSGQSRGALSQSRSVEPSMNSIATNTRSPTVPTSWTVITLGCGSYAAYTTPMPPLPIRSSTV